MCSISISIPSFWTHTYRVMISLRRKTHEITKRSTAAARASILPRSTLQTPSRRAPAPPGHSTVPFPALLAVRSLASMSPVATSKIQLKDPSLFVQQGWINGKGVDAKSGKTFEVEDPSTRAVIGHAPEMNCDDALDAIASCQKTFEGPWRKTTARERARLLRKYNDLVLENKDDLAKLIVAENGKPLKEAEGEVVYAASFLEWFAGEAERTYGVTIPAANPANRILTIKQPIGVVGSLCPWNLPIAMASRKIAAAVASGCTTVVKPAGETPFATLAINVLAERAGIPPGVINTITGLDTTPELGETICTDPRVKKVTFTGSTRVGKLLAKQCSSTLKKLTMELGGNAPFIVFEDADIKKVIPQLIATKLRNSGQTCTACQRLMVHKAILPEFVKELSNTFATLKSGGGTDPNATLGPLMSARGVDKVQQHIEQAQKLGAKIEWQAKKEDFLSSKDFEPGYFVPPTIISGLTDKMDIWQEETFGPLAAIATFETEEEAIRMANDSSVGLGSYLFTENVGRAWRVAEAIEAGMVAVNHGMLSAAESPFGGVKESGSGKEGGYCGMDDYFIVKAISFNISA